VLERLYTTEGLEVDRSEDELTFSRFERICERYPQKTALLYLGEA